MERERKKKRRIPSLTEGKDLYIRWMPRREGHEWICPCRGSPSSNIAEEVELKEKVALSWMLSVCVCLFLRGAECLGHLRAENETEGEALDPCSCLIWMSPRVRTQRVDVHRYLTRIEKKQRCQERSEREMLLRVCAGYAVTASSSPPQKEGRTRGDPHHENSQSSGHDRNVVSFCRRF